jgi:predicted nucleic acid-binding protein
LGETKLRFEVLAIDSNAAVDLLRHDRPNPPPFAEAAALVMPLFVLAELRYGFARATRAGQLEELVAACRVVGPDAETVAHYVRVREELVDRQSLPLSREKREGVHHDVWIAALCVQHRLPLLSNDRDMDRVSELEVIHW